MRIAFPLIGGKEWTGGRNYLLNLIRALAKHYPVTVTPVLFYGSDVGDHEIEPFVHLSGIEIVKDQAFDRRRNLLSLGHSIVFGCDRQIKQCFIDKKIDVVFEAARFFGGRIGVPTIAWLPDFQHRHLPHLFSYFAKIKRELGFQAQIAAGRMVMLSSHDACRDCEHFYPKTIGRTHAVHFAVPPPSVSGIHVARNIADEYDLPEHFIYLPNQFWVHKNHLLVAEALSILRKQGRHVVVVASGHTFDPRDPKYYERLCERVKALGIQENFRLLGLIPYEHLGALMQTSIALLNPSLFEGWSTTVEEARSLGVPLILSDLPVHREQMGKEGTYFERTSAASLAKVLASFQPLSLHDRHQLRDVAAIEAERRVGEFAKQFVAVAQRCSRGVVL